MDFRKIFIFVLLLVQVSVFGCQKEPPPKPIPPAEVAALRPQWQQRDLPSDQGRRAQLDQ
jgi:hypothetical protein